MEREVVEEIKRHFGVVTEGVRSDIRALAEGHQSLREEFRRELNEFRREVEGGIGLLTQGHQALREEFRRETQQFREEVRAEFQEVKAMIKFSYAELDRRVRSLETDLVELRARVERIEAHMAR